MGFKYDRKAPPRQLQQAQPPDEEEAGTEPEFRNVYAERYKVLEEPALRRQYYDRVAQDAGIEIGSWPLKSLVLVAKTPISYRTAHHPDLPVSFNVDIPRQSLRIMFQYLTFVRRATCSINTVVWTPGGLSGVAAVPPAPFEPQVLTENPMAGVNVLDYLYVQIKRDGGGQLYQTGYVAMSEFFGNATHPYVWEPVPIVERGGSLLFEVTILPEGQTQQQDVPPFIDRIGFLMISLHCDYFDAMGT